MGIALSCSHIAFPVQVPHRPRGCLVNHSHIHVQGCERPRTRRGGVTERRGRQNRCIMPSPPATAGGIGWGPRSGTGKDKLPDYRSVQASACIVLAFLARSDAECPARSVHLARKSWQTVRGLRTTTRPSPVAHSRWKEGCGDRGTEISHL